MNEQLGLSTTSRCLRTVLAAVSICTLTWVAGASGWAPISSAPAIVHADDGPEDRAKKQVEFGIQVARRGLWEEAIHRWVQAVELDPDNSSAQNNLAVAYEQAGKFELANEAYERALELSSDNIYIRQNYELFREAYERKKRKESDRGNQ